MVEWGNARTSFTMGIDYLNKSECDPVLSKVMVFSLTSSL